MFRFQPQYTSTAGVTNAIGTHTEALMGPTFTPGAGATMTDFIGRGLQYAPVFNNTGTANTILSSFGVQSAGTLTAAWSVTGSWGGLRMVDPGAAGSIARLLAVEIEDLTNGTANASVWSKGAAVFMAHGGPAIFCASQSTITAPATSAGIEIGGTTKALLLSRLTTTQKNALTAANGMLLYDTDRNHINFRENGSWIEFQPLDGDLLTIAALTVARGDVLVGIAGPAWGKVTIGSANTCFRSDGTDPAWSTGILDNNARVAVSKNSAATTGTRRRINLIEGTGITLTVADDSGNEEVDVTIASAAPTIVTDVVTGSTSTIPNGSNLTANTVTTTPGSGTEVHISASVCWDKTGATNKNVVLKLFKDGTEIDTADRYQHFNLAGSAATSQTTQSAHWVIASEASGSHTYTLRLEELAGTANTARRLVSRLTVIY
jgi:hypothetical protein